MKRMTTCAFAATLLTTLTLGGCPPITPPQFQPPNRVPHADSGPDINASVGEHVTLNAGGSTDPDDDALSYSWVQTLGPAVDLLNANQMQASFVPGVGGTYEFTVTVSDGNGGSDQARARVSIADEPASNHPGISPADSAGPPEEEEEETESPPPPPSPADAVLVRSTFDIDHEGWGTANNGTHTMPTWKATGGRPAGFIQARFFYETVTGYWDAPAKFLGDLSKAHDGTLSFDLSTTNAGRANDSHPIVLLTGGGIVLALDTPYTPGTGWTSYSARLNESGGWKNYATGLAATPEEIQAVLSALIQIRIRGDRGTNHTGGLDDVKITVPLDAP